WDRNREVERDSFRFCPFRARAVTPHSNQPPTESSEGVANVPSVAHSTTSEIIHQFDAYVVANYRRYPVALVRGEGSWVWDAEGNRYLDFFPGWGCNLLGHCPPRVVEAVREQVGQLIHVPNTWYMEAQGALGEALAVRGFGGQSFFCNSG